MAVNASTVTHQTGFLTARILWLKADKRVEREASDLANGKGYITEYCKDYKNRPISSAERVNIGKAVDSSFIMNSLPKKATNAHKVENDVIECKRV